MKKLIALITCINRRFSEDNVTVYGAQASFFIMVSLGPFLIALAAVMQFFLPVDKLESLQIIYAYLPAGLKDITNIGANEIFTNSTPSIISISVILALWSASKGLLSLERCLHAIYRVDEQDNYILRRLKASLYTILFLVSLVFALGFLVFGNTIQSLLTEIFPWLEKARELIIALRALFSISVFILTFAGIYQVLSGARRRFTAVLPGVIFATAGWMIFSWLYAYYITNFSRYTYIYGSLGAITLFMLWIYFCILILLAGAELNVYLEKHHSSTASSSN